MEKLINFQKYTSIHIGGEYSVKIIDTIDNYSDFIIIGKGNNLLVSDTPPAMAILGDQFDYIFQKDGKLVVGAATSSGKLLQYCKKNNIAHFEFLAKLPGTLGGIVKMNGGLKQWEIFNHLVSIKTQKGEIFKKDIPHSYRHTQIDGIIYEATFDIETGYDKELQKEFNKMRENQPLIPSAGSCFKNPKEHSAGYLIEQVGLKGYTLGGMAFSLQHANFLVNNGGGTFQEALELIDLAQKKVQERFHIKLELEIVIL